MSRRLYRSISTLPLTLPTAIAAFGVVAVGLLLIGRLEGVLVWPLGLAAAVGAAAVTHARAVPVIEAGSHRERRTCDVLALVLVVAWSLVNAHHSAQNVFVYRDPAVYAVTGAWLVDEDDLVITTPTGLTEIGGVIAHSAGFGRDVHDEDRLYAQGLHLLPALLGLTGRLGGEALMLKLNVALGAVGLLAVYGFARLIARPRSALVATTALALSLPIIYFSRDTYTEPLSMAMVFGTLSMLWAAGRSGSPLLWWLAGLVSGSGALLRADGYVPTVALTGFAVLLLVLAPETERVGTLHRARLLLIGAALPSLLGWLDATRLSSGYYSNHGVEIRQQLVLWAAVLAVAPLLIGVGWRTPVLGWLDRTTRRWRGPAAAATVAVVALVLASRPLWMVDRNPEQVEGIGTTVAKLQVTAGELPDPSRTYAENSATWLVWYLGIVVVVLGVVGLAALAARAVRPGGTLLLPAVVIVAGTSLVFLVQVGITPDHVWAARRFLPVTMPGLAVFAAVGLDLVGKLPGIRRGRSAVATAVLGAGMVVGPLPTAWPFLRVRTYVPQLAQVRDVCAALPDDGLAVLVGVTGNIGTRTVAAFCDVPAVWAHSPGHAALQGIVARSRPAGRVPMLVVAADELQRLPADVAARLDVVSTISFEVIPGTLHEPPRETEVRTRTLLVGGAEAALRPRGGPPPIEMGPPPGSPPAAIRSSS